VSLRNEIPQRAFINAQIIQSAEELDSWKKSKLLVSSKYSLPEYEFINPAYVVSLLYCLLVVPKEIWIKNNKYHKVFSEVDENELKDNITSYRSSDPKFETNFSYNIAHKLRNSVAHANYEIDHELNFEFWDEFKGKENFRCKFSSKSIMWYLSEFGAKLANLRNKA